MVGDPRALPRAMFDAAVDAALPARVVPAHLPPPPRGRTVVVGAGKASAAMARAVEDAWPGPLEGLVVTRHGHAVPCGRIEVVEAAHPVPDEAGRRAAERIVEAVRPLGEDVMAGRVAAWMNEAGMSADPDAAGDTMDRPETRIIAVEPPFRVAGTTNPLEVMTV